jgi:hypothetical protein
MVSDGKVAFGLTWTVEKEPRRFKPARLLFVELFDLQADLRRTILGG